MSAGKDIDAKSTKRMYKCVNEAYQSFLILIAGRAERWGLHSFELYLPEQNHDYVNQKLV
jgi:hypothetical protein